MLELLLVVGILMVFAALAIPIFQQFSYNIRLRTATNSLSSLMQQARILAAKRNAACTLGYRTSGGIQQAYIDLNGNGAWDAAPAPGEPIIPFTQTIAFAPGPPTGGAGQPTPYVLVGDTGGTSYNNTTTLGWSPRGLPCAYAGGVCTTPAPGYFVYYLTDTRPRGVVGWGAVVVTRSGRTKSVIWNGTSWQ